MNINSQNLVTYSCCKSSLKVLDSSLKCQNNGFKKKFPIIHNIPILVESPVNYIFEYCTMVEEVLLAHLDKLEIESSDAIAMEIHKERLAQ